jgi:hypothetical protein
MQARAGGVPAGWPPAAASPAVAESAAGTPLQSKQKKKPKSMIGRLLGMQSKELSLASDALVYSKGKGKSAQLRCEAALTAVTRPRAQPPHKQHSPADPRVSPVDG